MEAVNIVFSSIRDNNIVVKREKYETLIKLILGMANHDSLDITDIMNKACCYECLDVVTYILDNIDLKKCNMIHSENNVCNPQILENVNHDFVLEILNTACFYGNLDVVTFVLQNIDHKKLAIMEAVYIVYSSIMDDNDDDDINDSRVKYEPLIRQILKEVNHDLLDLKTVFYQAFCKMCLDVVSFLLENTDQDKLDVNRAMKTAVDPLYCASFQIGTKESSGQEEILIKLILEKVNHDSLELKEIMEYACCKGYLDVVKYLLENTDHGKLGIMEAYSKVSNDDYVDNEPIIIQILEKVNHDLLDLKEVFIEACRTRYLEVVTYLLENTDHDKLDEKETRNAVINTLFVPNSFSNLSMRMNHKTKIAEPLIKLILERVNNDSLALEEILNYACWNGYIDVVKYLLDNIDHDVLDVKGAVNDVYRCVCDIDYDDDDLNNQREKYETIILQILEKVNHDLLDLKHIFVLACRICFLDVVTYLLENIDHDKLDVKETMNTTFDLTIGFSNFSMRMNHETKMTEPLMKLILEKVNHDSLPLEEIMNYACWYCYIDVVRYLLENIDHDKLDVKGAVNDVYRYVCDIDYDDDDLNNQREKYETIILQILEKVNHDLLNLKHIFVLACAICFLDVVTYLLENIDHDKLDVKETMNTTFDLTIGFSNFSMRMNHETKMAEPLIKLILERVNHDLLSLQEIMNYACLYCYIDVVKYLLENADHEKLDIMEAFKDAYSTVSNDDYYDDDMNDQRRKYEHFIIQILENVNHDLLDLKKVFIEACRTRYIEVVTYLLENKDHTTLNFRGAVNKLCYPSIDEDTDDEFWYVYSNEAVTKLLLQRVKVDLLDVEVLLNVACRKEWLDIARWLVENVAHSMFDIDTSMNVLMLRSSENNLAIFKLLLENISQNLFDIRSVIEQASRINHTEKVLLLLQTQNNTLFDIKYVMNEVCRNSNLLVIKYVMENIDKQYFDVRSAMNKACRSEKSNSLEVVKLLLENIPHNMFNLESAMNNACRYDNVEVVDWFWNNLDRKLFNEKSSWNNAFYNCNEKMISYLLNNMDENMLDKSKALYKACQNIKEGYKIMALLFKQPNINTPENCKLVLTEACIYCNRNVVTWLMSHTDIHPLVYKTSLIDTIKAMANNRGKSDRVSIVQFMLEHDSIKKLGQNDMSEVMGAVSSIGQLAMVQRLWHTTKKSMFNMRAIVNTACESGQFEIVDWFLRNNELKHIDVQTVMVESCAYGWLKIVKLLLSKFDQRNFDLWTSIDEACSYGRYEIVKFLLENVDSKLFDTDLVLEKACGYGWKEIILWLFDNIDNSFIDLKACMFEACAQGRLEIVELLISKYGTNNFKSDVDILISISCKNSGNRGVIKFLIENFDLTQSHIDIIIKSACTYGLTEIVTLILDSCKHNKNLMDEAMKNACNSGETEIVEIFLEKVDASFIEIKHAMIISCQKGWNELVSVLLERVDHSLFDLTVAMNEACRCGEADIVELLIEKVDHKFFNFEKAIMEACQSHLNENLVLILLKYINNSTRDIEGMSKKAHEYGWRKVSSRLKRMSYNEN